MSIIPTGFAKLIAGIRFNHIRVIDQRIVLKRRRWYGGALTAAGNSFVAITGGKVRILHELAWLRREQMLYRCLYEEDAIVRPGQWLEMPWRGTVLSEILADPNRSSDHKLEALRLAARELFRVHAILVTENGFFARFSHGDAGVGNVALSPGTGTARWFDFEIVHQAGLPDDWRRADDLRALVFSALGCLPESMFNDAVQQLVKAYQEDEIWAILRRQVQERGLESDLYHLAQARLSAAGHRRAIDALLRYVKC